MKELVSTLQKCLQTGQACELVTIIDSNGSTPRESGTHMLVLMDGSIRGTIGGGSVEYRSMQLSVEAIREKRSFVRSFELGAGESSELGMVCGGHVTVCFQYMDPESKELLELVQELDAALERNENSWLIVDLTDGQGYGMALCGRSVGTAGTFGCVGIPVPEKLQESFIKEHAVQRQVNGHRYYVEPIVREGSVYVFGGGHVARELVPLLTHVGFRCVVLDDREEFANAEMFPDAVQTIVVNMEHIEDFVKIGPMDYVCVMTRGHQYDYLVQRQALVRKPCYIGVMGSQHKIQYVTEKLLADGFSMEEIQSCHMPIGTKIGAVTPAEIAVSVAGELIQVRAQRQENDRKKNCPS